jgi:iron complex outermembrane receptor protein
VRKGFLFLAFIGMSLMGLELLAEGTVRGKVITSTGRQPGVEVVLKDKSGNEVASTETDGAGAFLFRRVANGTYDVEFSYPGLKGYTEEDITVTDDLVVDLDITLATPLNLMQVLTVASASRTPERVVEAPAAVSVITKREIEAQKAHGQVPRALENAPGVELAQTGVYDFNINARGFNSSLNRRILVLIDGRDPATGILGNQEWSAITYALDEVESMEMVRGPGSALYGANAFNGVLNIRTTRPVDDLGGTVNLSGGELSSHRIDARYSGEFGFGWAYKISAGNFASDSWSQSRTSVEEFEYPGLGTPELAGLNDDKVENSYASVRLDKETLFGNIYTVEFGMAQVENALAVTGIGRVQLDDVERPYFRFNWNNRNFNVSYWRSERETPDGQTLLADGSKNFEDSTNDHFEAQLNYDFFDDRVNLIFGGAYHWQEVDTANPATGQQTLFLEKQEAEQQALFGQLKWKMTDKLELILAGRWDDNDLHDAQTSPKAGLVWTVDDNHILRFTYNEAFQAPNFAEFFLRSPSAQAVPFGQIQQGLEAAIGIPLDDLLGWQDVFVVAAGNENLETEEIESFEVGYKGILFGNLFLSVDIYQSTLTNFVTDLLPGVNPAYTGGFMLPAGTPPALVAAIEQTFAGLPGGLGSGIVNLSDAVRPPGGGFDDIPDGHPVVVFSYTNAGEVDTEGIDIAFNYFINNNWTLDGTYSWFDFDIVDDVLASSGQSSLVPNSSDSKLGIGVTYTRGDFSGSVKYRRVKGFDWSAGVYQGFVPTYDLVNLAGQYRFNERFSISMNITNAADDEHYQLFGGSVLGRRAVASIQAKF